MPYPTTTVTPEIHAAVVAGVVAGVPIRRLACDHALTIGQVSATVRRARRAGELPPAGLPVVGRKLTPAVLAARAAADLRRRTERRVKETLQRAAARAEREAARAAPAPKPAPAPRAPRGHCWQRAKPIERLDFWSPADDDTVVRRILAGDEPLAIGRDIGRSRGAVMSRICVLRAAGRLPPRVDMSWTMEADDQLIGLRSQGLSLADIATRMERSESSLMTRMTRLRRQGVAVGRSSTDRRWRKVDLELVETMALGGSTPAEIAAAVGRTSFSVGAKMTELRLDGTLPSLSGDDEPDETHEPGRVRYPTPGADPLLAALFAAHAPSA